VAAEVAVLDQDLVWAVAFPAVVAEEAEQAAQVEAPAQADQAAGLAAPAAALMLEICGVRRGRGAIAVVAQGPAEPVEGLAVAQAVPVDPEGVLAAAQVVPVDLEEVVAAASEVAEAALAGAARERVLQAAAPAVEVASEVAAGVAQLEAPLEPAGTQANG
jgi:hypothetical protein